MTPGYNNVRSLVFFLTVFGGMLKHILIRMGLTGRRGIGNSIQSSWGFSFVEDERKKVTRAGIGSRLSE